MSSDYTTMDPADYYHPYKPARVRCEYSYDTHECDCFCPDYSDNCDVCGEIMCVCTQCGECMHDSYHYISKFCEGMETENVYVKEWYAVDTSIGTQYLVNGSCGGNKKFIYINVDKATQITSRKTIYYNECIFYQNMDKALEDFNSDKHMIPYFGIYGRNN